MFSQTAEYALRAVYYLSQNKSESRTTKEIANLMRIPQSYLAKIMQALVKAGVVRSRRGVRGGFQLSKDPADQNLLDVVVAVDPQWGAIECPFAAEQHHDEPCPLHKQINDAVAQVEQAFSRTTLAMLSRQKD